MKKRYFLSVLIMTTICVLGTADDTILCNGRILPEKTEQVSFEWSGNNDGRTILVVNCRREAATMGRSAYILTLKLNGKILAPYPVSYPRLLNRPLVSVTKAAKNILPKHGDPIDYIQSLYREKVGGGSKKQAETNAECKEGAWLVYHAPDWREGKSNVVLFEYRFDVTDMLQKGKNTLLLRNQEAESESSSGQALDLKIRLLVDNSELFNPSLYSKIKAFPMPDQTSNIDKVLWKSSDGVILESTWKVEGCKLDNYEEKVNVSATFKADSSKDGIFTISENLNNPYDFPILVKSRNILQFKDGFEELKIAGINYPSCMFYQKTLESPNWKQSVVWRKFSENPTAFVKTFSGLSAGVMLLDDASRNQHAFEIADPVKKEIGWESGFFRIESKEELTLKWQIRFMNGDDYFGFINHLRKEMNLNNVVAKDNVCFIDVYALMNYDVEKLRKQLNFHKAGAVIVWGGYHWPDPAEAKPPYEVIYGASLLKDPYKGHIEYLRKAGAKLKEADPKVKFLPYMHLSLVGPLSKEDIENYSSELCRQKSGDYTARAWGAADRNKDFYRADTLSYSIIPTYGKKYAEKLQQTLDELLKTTGADGFFLDEFGGEFYDYSGESQYYDLDRNGKFYPVRSVGLKGNAFVGQVLQDGFRQGLSFWGNGGNLNLQLSGIPTPPVFSEARLNLLQPAETVHLATPIGLWYRPNPVTVRMLLEEGLMPGGTALNWQYNFTGYLYPFTPEKIGKGYVIGREALITAKPIILPEAFTGKPVKLHTFSKDAEHKEMILTFKAGGKIEIPDDGFVIIRLD